MIVAFDCDGTLINDRDEPNHRMIDLLRWFADNGDRIYVWSGGGVEYAQRWIDRFALPATAIEKGGTYVDLAIDDEIVELGKINLKIKRFQLPPTKPTGEGECLSRAMTRAIEDRIPVGVMEEQSEKGD